MKKTLLIILTILALTISVSNVKADRRLGESAYINDNGVMIHKTDYSKLVQLGLMNTEIKFLTQEEFDRYISFNIDSKATQKFFVKTEYPVIDGSVVSQQTLMNEEDFYQEYAQRQASLNNETVAPVPGTMSTLAAVSEEEVVSTNLNIFTVTVTFDGCQGLYGEFLVKTNMEWLFQPTQRYEELSGVIFSNNLTVKPKYVGDITGPEFTNKLFYIENREEFDSINQIVRTTPTPKTVTIDYDDTQNYRADSTSILSKVKLPYDYRPMTNVNNRYTDFLITMETTLVARSHITAADVVGMYSHQYGYGNFDWNKVIVSTSTPYLTYIDEYFIDDPDYDPPFVGVFNFTNLQSGHRYTVIDSNETSHTITCLECGKTYTEDHLYLEGECSICHYVNHVHTFTTFLQYDGSSHEAICSICGHIDLQSHSYNWVSTSTYHYRKCIKCLYRTPNQLHTYITMNGMRFCSVCGYGSGIIQYSVPVKIQ